MPDSTALISSVPLSAMCSRSNLRTLFNLSIFLKFCLVVTLIVIGSIFLTDPDLSQAYGEAIIAHGGGLILVACLAPLSQYIGSRGSIQHNTFLLALHAVFEAILFFIQFSIALELLAIAEPEVSEAVRLDCMRMVPLEQPIATCNEYLESDRYAGFRLTWSSNYELAQTDPDFYSKLDGFQNVGNCCGFGPPLSCDEDARPYPNDRPLEYVPSAFGSQRQRCGSEDGWYPSSGSASYCASFDLSLLLLTLHSFLPEETLRA